MKNKRIFAAGLFVLIVIIQFSSLVSAAIMYRDRDDSYKFTFSLPVGMYEGGKDITNPLTTFLMDTEKAYCVMPQVISRDGVDYGTGSPSWDIFPTNTHNLTIAKQRNIELATVYGWELSSKTKVDDLYTKIYVSQQAGDATIKAVSGAGASLAGYNSWKTAINQKINSYLNVNPSFHGSTHNIIVGTTMTFTDTNSVLNEYTITNTPTGLTASISGNTLTVTASDTYAGGSVTLNRLQPYQGTSLYYFTTLANGKWRQGVIVPGIPSPKVATIRLNPQAATGKFRLKKTDAAGASLSGAAFRLTGAAIAPINFTMTSDTYSSVLLDPGTYTLTETKAPTGYVLDPTPRQIVIVAGETNDVHYNTPIKNNAQQVRVQITKRGINNTNLAGAVFEVRRGNTVVDTITTNASGIAESKPLSQSSYTLREITAPLGYALSPDTSITLAGDNTGSAVITYDVVIRDNQTVTEISKKDATTGEELSGATLTVKEKESGEVIETWVSTDTPHVIRGLHQGKTYVLTETIAPLGYSLSQDVEFTIDGKNGVVNKVEMKDDLTVTEISKKDATTGEELPGATLTVKEKESGEVIDTWVSTEQPYIIRGLHQGKTYVLTEDLAPLGYALSQDVEFTIDGSNGVTNKVEMKDDLTVTEISKKDATTGEELPGATLTVKEKESGDLIETWVSTEQLHIIRGLHQGKTYVLTETIAPLGYALSQDVEFTIDGKNSVVNKVEMKDELTVTEISKKDFDSGTELKDAVLILREKESGKYIKIWRTENAPHVIEGLHQGKTYQIIEYKAPLGYALSEIVEFTVDGSNGVTNKVEMTDKLTITEISKKDATTGEELPGATLTVKEKESDDVIETWVSTDIPHVIRGLHQGKTYVLTEDLAPLGYALSQDVEFTIDGSNGVTNKVEMKDDLTVTEISKKDATTVEGLPGATLAVKEKESGEVIESWISTKEPHVIRGLHQGKTYVLQEIEAPEGYIKGEDIEFTIDGSNSAVNTVSLENIKMVPKTGETGGRPIFGALVLMVGVAGIIIITRLKQHEKA